MLELVEKYAPDAIDITTSVRQLPNIKLVKYSLSIDRCLLPVADLRGAGAARPLLLAEFRTKALLCYQHLDFAGVFLSHFPLYNTRRIAAESI